MEYRGNRVAGDCGHGDEAAGRAVVEELFVGEKLKVTRKRMVVKENAKNKGESVGEMKEEVK